MKLLFCKACNTIVSPFSQEFRVRRCDCEKHSIWWTNSLDGHLAVFDHDSRESWHYRKMAFVLSIPNMFLEYPEPMHREDIKDIQRGFPSGFVFSHYDSCVVRTRPNETVDTFWVDQLPVTVFV